MMGGLWSNAAAGLRQTEAVRRIKAENGEVSALFDKNPGESGKKKENPPFQKNRNPVK